MKYSIFLLFTLSTYLLPAQLPADFMGKWELASGTAPFDEIRIQASSLSEEKPVVLFYKASKLWNRNLGSWNTDKGLALVISLDGKAEDWSMHMMLGGGMNQLKLAAKVRNNRSAKREKKQLLFKRNRLIIQAGPIDKKPEPQVMQIGEIELDKPKTPQKASFGIRLYSCKPCQQYVIHLYNDNYQKTAIPNAEGLGKFSQIPYGRYEVSVGWKGKIDRPDAPPYKKLMIQINKSHKKNYSVPLK
ncbi:MAG: hypothetical protein AAF696_09280 [Bacteroidota bacterium]